MLIVFRVLCITRGCSILGVLITCKRSVSRTISNHGSLFTCYQRSLGDFGGAHNNLCVQIWQQAVQTEAHSHTNTHIYTLTRTRTHGSLPNAANNLHRRQRESTRDCVHPFRAILPQFVRTHAIAVIFRTSRKHALRKNLVQRGRGRCRRVASSSSLSLLSMMMERISYSLA